MSILLAYEDRYCRGLDLTIRRAINRAGVLTVPREFIPVDGVSNFLGFVERRWPLFRDNGFPTPGKPKPRALICIADADVVASQLSLVPRKSPSAGWVSEAEQEFTARLRSQTDQPQRIYGALLRWNLESTLIAAYDEPEAMQRLAGRTPLDLDKLENFLRRDCRPTPNTVSDEQFLDTFDNPQRCLARLAKALGWRKKLKKGDPRKDDSLSWASKERLDKLTSRVPDLARIAAQVRRVAVALQD